MHWNSTQLKHNCCLMPHLVQSINFNTSYCIKINIWYLQRGRSRAMVRLKFPPNLEGSWLAKSGRGKCVISHTFTPSRITTVSFTSLRDFKLGLISRLALKSLTLLAHYKLVSPSTAIQLESCGRSQFIVPELVLSVFHLNCQSCDDLLRD